MSSTQAIIRTQATSLIGAQWLASDFSIFKPQGPALAKGHVREVISQALRSGNFVPSGSPRFEVQRNVDVMTMVHLRWTANAITVASWNGGATFARYIDFIGLYGWNKILVKSGTQLLQTIYPDEILCAIYKVIDNEHRRNILDLVRAGSPAQRSAWALGPQEVFCPLLTCLGLSLHGDPSQSLYVRGLNDYMTFEVSLNSAAQVIETDGTQPTAPAAGIWQDGVLHIEGFHVNGDERAQLASMYKEVPHSITYDDVQYASPYEIDSTRATTALVSFNLQNISQPVTYLCFLFRWVDDLGASVPRATGSRGFNPTNIAGWWNPAGGANGSFIDTIQIKSGNNDVLSTIPADRLVRYQHERDFKGDGGAAIPAVSYSHDASMKNAVLGFVSFDQIERPTVFIQLKTPTTGTAHATVGAAALADIGSTCNLQVQVVGFTKADIDCMNFLLSKPFN